jgi:glutathione S-transferase
MILLYDLVGADERKPFSPHCWKAAMALRHKGLDFRSVPTRFLDVPKVEGGESKIVPMIRDGDRVVSDSFDIALYLEKTYPERPTLFGGPGGEAMARFIERWSQGTLHLYLGTAAILDIHALQDEANAAYFRRSREEPLEEVATVRDGGLEAFRKSLDPLRTTLRRQPFIGGQTPLFPDYIVFGALQWARVASPFAFLAKDDPVSEWFGRCLDLYDGFGRSVPAAA